MSLHRGEFEKDPVILPLVLYQTRDDGSLVLIYINSFARNPSERKQAGYRGFDDITYKIRNLTYMPTCDGCCKFCLTSVTEDYLLSYMIIIMDYSASFMQQSFLFRQSNATNDDRLFF